MTEEDLVAQALPLPTEERARFLDDHCRGRPDLRERVERRLALQEAKAQASRDPLADTADSADWVPPQHLFGYPGERRGAGPDLAGQTVGPYKLQHLLGEGGMGTVWAAEQTHPVRRKVALKLIKSGLDSARIVARFNRERQALALMDHPSIARMYDAGEAPDGRPYFAMELVKGVAITKYCDDVHAPLDERLRLFLDVCSAMQHAHTKGIVHRDLKPSNCLVAFRDGRPVPKVIDFGVAKALFQKLSEATLETHVGRMIGTLEYMAPEQADLTELDIDTRADVYALGVLLFELLVGSTPLNRDRLKYAGLDEVLRLIKDEEPPRPSTRLRQSKATTGLVATARRTDPRSLQALLAGELDWIVLKALEKDRTRRYETADAFRRDVERFLADEPVEARPPTRGYRLRKFLKRHRGAATAAAGAALALVIGVAGLSWGLVAANDARAAAAHREQGERAAKEEARRESAKAEASLLQLHSSNGREFPLPRAFPWLARAVQLDERQRPPSAGAPASVHRVRIGYALRNYPRTELLLTTPRLNLQTKASPDGRFVAGLSYAPQKLTLWDLERPASPVELATPDEATTFAFAPNGAFLAVASPAAVAVFPLGKATLEPSMRLPAPRVTALAFCKGSPVMLATASAEHVVILWDASSGRRLAEAAVDGAAEDLAFSPEGRRLLIACPGEIRLLDRDGLHERFRWTVPKGNPLAVGFSRDGRHVLAAGGDWRCRCWSVATGRLTGESAPHRGRINSLSTSPDGRRLATASTDGTARLWTLPDLALAGPPLEHRKKVHRADFSPDGLWVATASDDYSARIWDVASGKPALPDLLHEAEVDGAFFHPRGDRLLTSCQGAALRLWDLTAAAPDLPTPGLDRPEEFEFHPTAGEALTLDDERLMVWTLRPARLRLMTAAPGLSAPIGYADGGNSLFAVVRRPGGRYALQFWNAEDGRPLRTVAVRSQPLQVIQAPKGGRFVALFIHDAQLYGTDGPVGPPIRHDVDGVLCAAFSPDGRLLATGARDGAVRLWDAATGAPDGAALRHDVSVYSVAFAADGRTLLTAASGEGKGTSAAVAWDVATRRRRAACPSSLFYVLHAALSPDGRTAASATSQGAVLWDLESGRPTSALPLRHDAMTAHAAFAGDGRFVATASWDNTARVWEADSGLPVTPPIANSTWVNRAAFSADGDSLALSVKDAAARLIDLAPDDRPVDALLDEAELLACARVDDRGFAIPLIAAESAVRALHIGRMALSADRRAAWHARRGAAAEAAGRPGAAIDHYTAAIEAEPDAPVLWRRRAELHAERGEWRLAATDLAAALRLGERHPLAQARLALLLAATGRDAEARRQVSSATAALADAPDCPSAREIARIGLVFGSDAVAAANIRRWCEANGLVQAIPPNATGFAALWRWTMVLNGGATPVDRASSRRFPWPVRAAWSATWARATPTPTARTPSGPATSAEPPAPPAGR